MTFEFIHIDRKPNEQIIDILENDPIGTPGKSIVYFHKNVEDNVRNLPDPYFINLYLRNYLLGTVCFSRREVIEHNVTYSAYYIRYFYFRKQFRSTGSEKSQRSGKKSPLRSEIIRLLEGEGLPSEYPILFYAYADPGNIRSIRQINEFGLRKIGSFSALIFSRLFPKINPLVEEISISENPRLIQMLTEFYKDYQLVTFDNLIKHDNYFILKEHGEIVCGIQAVPEYWEIKEIPGITGMIIMRTIPYIPLLRRLFNPDYRFVYLDGLFCKPGHEKKLESLFSSVMKRYQVFSAILCADETSGLYQVLKLINLGIINYIQDEIKMIAMAKTTKGQSPVINGPIYISGIDVM
ncbi:hypothetical protein ACFLU5_06710 [Bacteroidota bacterium]